jgi:hypothetical protein
VDASCLLFPLVKIAVNRLHYLKFHRKNTEHAEWKDGIAVSEMFTCELKIQPEPQVFSSVFQDNSGRFPFRVFPNSGKTGHGLQKLRRPSLNSALRENDGELRVAT